MLAAEEDADDVNLELVAEHFERYILDRPVGGDARIVDEDVDALAGREGIKPLLLLRDVEADVSGPV